MRGSLALSSSPWQPFGEDLVQVPDLELHFEHPQPCTLLGFTELSSPKPKPCLALPSLPPSTSFFLLLVALNGLEGLLLSGIKQISKNRPLENNAGSLPDLFLSLCAT